jgi:hypothetical protein
MITARSRIFPGAGRRMKKIFVSFARLFFLQPPLFPKRRRNRATVGEVGEAEWQREKNQMQSFNAFSARSQFLGKRFCKSSNRPAGASREPKRLPAGGLCFATLIVTDNPAEEKKNLTAQFVQSRSRSSRRNFQIIVETEKPSESRLGRLFAVLYSSA